MKKVLSVLLTFCMLMALALPVFAEETPLTLTVTQTNASKGSEVTVLVDVSNNPGIAGIVLTLKYDANALTLERYENGTVFSAAPTVAENYVWTASGANTTVNGTLLKLVFTVNEAAVEGNDYPVEIIVRECSNVDLQAVSTQVIDGNVSVVAPHSEITDASMSLSTDIAVNYYAQLDPSHEGAQMKFTLGENETLVDGVATENAGEYVYTFKGLAPQRMGDLIGAELMLNGEVLDSYEDYSVLAYCNALLAYTPEELGISAEKYAAMVTLIADMLEYGAQAQLYRGYKTNALVNANVTGQTEFAELTDTVKMIEESGRDDVKMKAIGMYFDYTNSLYLKFTAPGMTDDTFYISVLNDVTGEEIEYTLSDCTLIDEATSTYLLVMDPISATQFEDLYCIELFAPRATGSSTTPRSQQYLEYSVAAYVYSMQNKTDGNGILTPMAKLARATYNYGLSAAAYMNIA